MKKILAFDKYNSERSFMCIIYMYVIYNIYVSMYICIYVFIFIFTYFYVYVYYYDKFIHYYLIIYHTQYNKGRILRLRRNYCENSKFCDNINVNNFNNY